MAAILVMVFDFFYLRLVVLCLCLQREDRWTEKKRRYLFFVHYTLMLKYTVWIYLKSFFFTPHTRHFGGYIIFLDLVFIDANGVIIP